MAYSQQWEIYQAEIVRKFGSFYADLDTPCDECGEFRGEHYGATCPKDINGTKSDN